MERFPFKLDPQSNSENTQLIVNIAKLEETEELHRFLVEHFIASTPTNQLFQLNEPGVDEEILKLRRERPWYLSMIRESENLCLTVRDESAENRLAAICMCAISEKSAPVVPINEVDHKKEEATKLFNGNLHKFKVKINQLVYLHHFLTAVMKTLKEGVDLHAEYQTNSILWLRILTVHLTYSRRGLGKRLIQEAMQMGRDRGAGAILLSAVSHYMFKAAADCGFQTHSTLNYATFEFEGKKPFENDPVLLTEHTKVCFMACSLHK